MGSREGRNRKKYERKHEKISLRKVIENTNDRRRKNTSIKINYHFEAVKFSIESGDKIYEAI